VDDGAVDALLLVAALEEVGIELELEATEAAESS
jgi:hypothetical protein